MIVLDENILDGQRVLLEAWRLAPRQIGVNLGRKGLKDEEIIVLLRRQRNPTFSHAMQASISRASGIEATASFWRVWNKTKWLRSFDVSFTTPNSILARRGWGEWPGFRMPALRSGVQGRKPKFTRRGLDKGEPLELRR